MRLQHSRSAELYSGSLQAARLWGSCSVFVRPTRGRPNSQVSRAYCSLYGLQRVFPQSPPRPPPSACATVGITKVLRKRTAAARISKERFTVGFLLVTGDRP